MVRFNDKPLITTLSDDDIMPITDMSEPSSDKKMNMKQLSEYVANLASHDVASAFKTLGTETVSSDSSAYNEILDRKHSSFDRSKFNVVGSPTITDDGIASGFSGSNYIQIPNLNISNSNNFEFISPIYKIKEKPSGTTQSLLIATSTNELYLETFINTAGTLYVTVRNKGISLLRSPLNIDINNTYQFRYLLKNGVWTTFYQINSDNIWHQISTANDSNTVTLSYPINIGYEASSIYLHGFVDLKNISIKSNDIEVFNGNKTAIDIIKEDNYQVVGSPVISDDGIASGFRDSNSYLKIPTYDLSKPFKILMKFKANTLGAGQSHLLYDSGTGNAFNFNNRFGFAFYINPDKRITISSSTDGTVWDNENLAGSTILQTNQNYWIKVTYENNILTLYLSLDGINYQLEKSLSNINIYNNLTYSVLGCYMGGYNYLDGQIDLNAFKIYIDGNLVYQPCLKIPYIESKTGSKIVPAHARSRVFDLYEQTGKALYYTIDEENKNFTAPLSDIYGMITDNANLKNFTPEGKDRFESQNAYLTGDVLKEEQGLNQVKMMKHSTFDKSKFTVVGSPSITDDGIASRFSESNYIQKVLSSQLTQSDNYKVKIGFIPNDISTTQYMFSLGGQYKIQPYFLLSSNSLQTTYKDSNNSEHYLSDEILNNQLNILEIENINATTYIKINGTLRHTLTDFTNVIKGLYTLFVNQNFLGSIDLKQFSITVDGVEVFNGNKTGIDQIKADNFTKVGNVVVSDDGIASVFSGSNYLNSPNLTTSGDKYEISFEFNSKNTVATATQIMYVLRDNTNSNEGLLMVYKNNQNKISIAQPSVYGAQYFFDATVRNNNTRARVDITYVKSQGHIQVNYYENGMLIKSDGSSTTADWSNISFVRFGYSAYNGFQGSIDLNAFKIYVDGNLVYQPTLKIPYTQSKTGSKIANFGSRDRVQDMYEQFGYAPYYTLEDDSFTLPKGEVYGLIGSRSLKSHFRSGINYYDVYSDRELEQGGACTANVAVNLLKPYEDANYVLSVPYSAKTATSFTPTTSGTWMAKGIAKSLD